MKRDLKLDILRGFAVICVLGAHLDIPFPDQGIIRSLASTWKSAGGTGVYLFFVLSGYLISGLLFSEYKKRGCISIGRFLVRRGWKIYPPYYFFIGYIFFVPLLKALYHGQDVFAKAKSLLSNLWPTLLFVQNYIGEPAVGHTWTLAVEEHFYISLPLIVAGLIAFKRLHWLVPLGLLAPVIMMLLKIPLCLAGDPYLTNTDRTLSATHLVVDGLFLGVGFRAWAEFYPASYASLRRCRYWLLLVSIALLLFWPSFTVLGLPSTWIFPVKTFGVAALFLAMMHSQASDLKKLQTLAKPAGYALGWIGTYSYCIYLWHVTPIRILERDVIPRLGLDPTSQLGWLLSALLLCGAAIGVGSVISFFLERPVLKFRDKFFPSRS